MVLNNLKNYLKNLNMMGGQMPGYYTISPAYPVKCTDGTIQTQFCTATDTSNYSNYTPFFGWGASKNKAVLATSQTSKTYDLATLVLGTGKTPVTEDDYCLESIITDNISLASQNCTRLITVDVENQKLTKKATLIFNIKNTGANDIEVSELGLLHCFFWGSSTSYAKMFLAHREVLETPVTIPAGKIRVFQFEFEFVNQLA